MPTGNKAPGWNRYISRPDWVEKPISGLMPSQRLTTRTHTGQYLNPLHKVTFLWTGKYLCENWLNFHRWLFFTPLSHVLSLINFLNSCQQFWRIESAIILMNSVGFLQKEKIWLSRWGARNFRISSVRLVVKGWNTTVKKKLGYHLHTRLCRNLGLGKAGFPERRASMHSMLSIPACQYAHSVPVCQCAQYACCTYSTAAPNMKFQHFRKPQACQSINCKITANLFTFRIYGWAFLTHNFGSSQTP